MWIQYGICKSYCTILYSGVQKINLILEKTEKFMILIMIQKKKFNRFSNPQSLFSSSAAVIKAKEGHIKEKFRNSHLT